MIITIVCDILGDKNNGLSVVTHNLINYLSKKHEIRVICPDKDKDANDNFYIVPTFKFAFINNYVKKNGVSFAKPDISVILKALDKTDVVYITTPFFLSRKIVKICKEKKIPYVFGFHFFVEIFTSYIPLGWMFNNFLNRLIYRKFVVDCAVIHYPTNIMREKFEKSIQKKTIGYVISNGVSNDFFVNNDIDKINAKKQKLLFLKDNIIILNISRYVYLKKQEILIKAVKYSKYKDSLQLVFLGHGPKEEKLKKIAFKEKLKNYPIFKFVKHEEISDIIKVCDLYVHTSDFESEGISILEAMAGGLIPIISNSEDYGKHFALSDNNLFQKDNYKDLAKKIDFWIENHNERIKQKENYRKFVEKFRLEICMSEIEKMFTDVVNNKVKQ